MDEKDISAIWRIWKRRKSNGRTLKSKDKDAAPPWSRRRDLLLAFALVSLPMLVIAAILLAFVFDPSQREKQQAGNATQELPIQDQLPANAYYTTVRTGNFLLVASWASNISEFIIAPFMLLFSYAVAREILQQSRENPAQVNAHPPLLKEILRGAHAGLWHWGSSKTSKKGSALSQGRSAIRAVDVAAFGLFTATFLTCLVVVGDNWIHATTHSTQFTHYEDVTSLPENHADDSEIFNETNGLVDYRGGFTLPALCDTTLNSPLPQNISSAPLPCSLNEINGSTNVQDPIDVYLTLDTGISQFTSDFNGLNFSTLADGEAANTATSYWVVTIPHNGSQHAMFFNPNAAIEYDATDAGPRYGPNYGIDYQAHTTSMVTQCTYATPECNISHNDTGTENLSIPFHCYDDFSGDLGQTPSTGHERPQGFNMSFYNSIDGTPKNIPVQAQSNPFTFYAATAVNSIDLDTFQAQSNRSEGNPGNGSLVDAGRGFIAFALKCEATIYDVTFSLVNGSFKSITTTRSTPQKASIVQAPLQVGFGQYHLYEAVALSVVANNVSVADTMGRAFSQTAMALASGVFDSDDNLAQRFRWTVRVTKVPKAPFWYLVVVCLVYAAFGMVMTVAAFYLRRVPGVREQQARLMVEWGPELLELEESEAKIRGQSRSRSRSRSGLVRASDDGADG